MTPMNSISFQARDRFRVGIETAVKAIVSGNDSVNVKGEYYGYFTNRLVKMFLMSKDAMLPSFGSFNFQVPKRQTLTEQADRLAASLGRTTPLESDADFGYVLMAVSEGVVKSLGPTVTVFVCGVLEHTRATLHLSGIDASDPKERAMFMRRYAVTMGVLGSVLHWFHELFTVGNWNEAVDRTASFWDGDVLRTKANES